MKALGCENFAEWRGKMAWRAYFAAFSVHSPIHVGYHTVSHAHRTRYYVPGKNMMSAYASVLDSDARGRTTAAHIGKNFLFTTFFVSKNGQDALYPMLTEDGDLFYGREGMSLWDFTNQFISAKEGQKYQVGKTRFDMEYIVPKNNVKKSQNYLVGYVFVSEEAEGHGFKNWLRALRELNIGEETGNRMGNVRLARLEKLLQDDSTAPFFDLEGIFLDWSGEKVRVVYEKPGPLLGYLKVEEDSPFLGIYGVQEATEGSIDLLRNVSEEAANKRCWVPGTLIKPAEAGSVFILGYDGMLTVQPR